MGTFLGYLAVLLLVGGVLFLLASFAFGRGEELAPMPPDGNPVELPDGRFGSAAIQALRLPVVLRGYRMADVDWVLEQLSGQLDERDRELARLRAAARAGSADAGELTGLPGPGGVAPDAGVAGPAEPVALAGPVDSAAPAAPADGLADPADGPAGPADPDPLGEPVSGWPVRASRAGSGSAVTGEAGEDAGNG